MNTARTPIAMPAEPPRAESHAASPGLPAGCASARDALALFDGLAAVDTTFLTGSWSGREFPSGHPLDGVLAAYGWSGKRFVSEEEVDPLLFRNGAREFALRPGWLVAGVPLLLRQPALKTKAVARLLRPALHLLATHRSRARLRMLQFRGVVSAAMVYDDAPIVDVFRRADERTVLGLMDLKGVAQPFFFVLERRPDRVG